VQTVDLQVDVTEAAGLGEPATIAVTVTLPDPATIPERPIVCFGKPGGGYSRGYYTADLPGPGQGAQADWHARRGWIFVSVDHLGVGDSTVHADRTFDLDYTVVAAGNQAAEVEILHRLAKGTLDKGFPVIADPLTLGIGQSMGGCLTIIRQGRYHCYDGIGVLGFSAVWTHPPAQPGTPFIAAPWFPRDVNPAGGVVVNGPALAVAELPSHTPSAGPAMAWGFHYDDVDRGLVAADLYDFPTRNGSVPVWGSATVPGAVAASCLTPGAVAPEAAAVRVPVLAAFGERDVSADPKGEPRAYLSANSVDLFICPRMGHMHNFASTRELFWRRIETWAAWVGAFDARRPADPRTLDRPARPEPASRSTSDQVPKEARVPE
jgi:alpha-beta hydrolase superfamily lysophospholipase